MKTSDNPHRRIKFMINVNRKKARAEYQEYFGRAVTDRSIEDELHHLVRGHDFEKKGGDRIAVPAELVLALILRPRGGKGSKRPPLELWKRRKRDLAIRSASHDWARQVEKEGRGVSKRAKHDAAKKAAEQFRIGVGTIKDKMTLAQGRRDLAREGR
jgi:hypothetical protein